MIVFGTGDELIWKFTSDSSVNGWGWKFTVYPVMPTFGPHDLLTDRTILSRPSMNVVMCLLDNNLDLKPNEKTVNLSIRLVAALAACAQVSSLSSHQRMWALQRLRKLVRIMPKYIKYPQPPKPRRGSTEPSTPTENLYQSETSESSSNGTWGETSAQSEIPVFGDRTFFNVCKGLRGLPDLLLKQYDYEEPIIRSGKHLMFSPFFKVYW